MSTIPLEETDEHRRTTHLAPRHGHILMSLGPCTEAAMIKYHIPAEWLPRLNALTQTASSREWAAMLQGVSFGFSMEKASAVSRVMILDIYGPLLEMPADLAAGKVSFRLIQLVARLTVLPRQQQNGDQVYYSTVPLSCH